MGIVYADLKNKEDRLGSAINPENFISCHFVADSLAGHQISKLINNEEKELSDREGFSDPQELIKNIDLLLSLFLPLFKID